VVFGFSENRREGTTKEEQEKTPQQPGPFIKENFLGKGEMALAWEGGVNEKKGEKEVWVDGYGFLFGMGLACLQQHPCERRKTEGTWKRRFERHGPLARGSGKH